ncbi:MAG: HAD family phosphatase [Candidatus Omnitrophica bacterium]|nr:HAD family phosphatase [Candidatus Omnitrophota bacterium]
MIEAIIFDLGNVLIDFDHRIAAQRISQFTDKVEQEIFNLFFDSHLTALFEEGKISPPDFFLKIKEALNLKLDYVEFLPIWNEIFFLSEKNQAVYKITRVLKYRYKLALLSNVNILHFEYVKKEYPVFNAFHHIITSFEVALRKPHPLIYQKALQLLGAEPEKTFYTDDRPELIETGRQLGIRSFVFKGIAQLKKDLSDTGIDIM